MTAVSFVLAVPHAASPALLPSDVATPEEVLTSRPALWCSPGTPQIRTSAHLLIGVAFPSDGAATDPAEILAAGPGSAARFARHMVTGFWGAYCIIIRDQQTDELFVMADPSGLLPVYRLTTSRHCILTSHPALLGRALRRTLPVDYSALAAHLLQSELRQAKTCLAGLEESEPGTLASLDRRDRPPVRIWSPISYAGSHDIRSVNDCAEELRHIATRVLRCWINVLGKPNIAISGGVDSSFICAALASGGDDFACTTLATTNASGDERDYARQVASTFDRSLAEQFYDVALFDCGATASAGLPRPSRRLFQTVVDELLIASQQDSGCAVTLDGNGGDNLFCFLQSSAPIMDRIAAEGMGRGALETLIDMCAITGCSLPTVTAALVRRAFRGESGPRWRSDTRLLDPEHHMTRGDALTAWTDLPGPIPPGKREHIALLMRSQNHIHGFSAGLTRFSPLASQPLVEFCLGVPSWLWASGGRNRAVARAAFAHLLPAALTRRTSKAGPDSFLRQAFAAHRAEIAERLSEGLFAGNGLIDRDALAKALTGSELSESEDSLRVLDLLEAENWARSWS